LAQLGFLGLGIMGYPMARHLLAAGHDVALWSHTASKAKELAKEGKGTACATPREVAERADFIFYCVGDNDMARAITLGKDGLLEGVRKGSITSDCSTISPPLSLEIGKAFEAKGAHFLEAPVTGSKPGAEKGALTFMIGGDPAVYERAKPYMELMGKLFYYCGGPGAGLAAKLTQNLIGSSILQSFCEGIVLSTKAGVKPELMLEILENSAAKSGLASFKAPFIFNRDFTTNFSTKWMHKDVGMALEQGKALNVPLPVTAITHQMLGATIAKGWGEDDFCSAIRVLEDLSGVIVKKS
jgi:3-hydroxyisobutyrate dehydrogenase-like beta-hydroxyacid dehydrogenase